MPYKTKAIKRYKGKINTINKWLLAKTSAERLNGRAALPSTMPMPDPLA